MSLQIACVAFLSYSLNGSEENNENTKGNQCLTVGQGCDLYNYITMWHTHTHTWKIPQSVTATENIVTN